MPCLNFSLDDYGLLIGKSLGNGLRVVQEPTETGQECTAFLIMPLSLMSCRCAVDSEFLWLRCLRSNGRLFKSAQKFYICTLKQSTERANKKMDPRFINLIGISFFVESTM